MLQPVEICHLYISPGHNFVGHHGREPGTHPDGRSARDRMCRQDVGFAAIVTSILRTTTKARSHFFRSTFSTSCALRLNLHGYSPALTRRNVITRGVDLNEFIGNEFEVQGVCLYGTQECAPCYWMDGALALGAKDFLKGSGGLRAKILSRWPVAVDRVHPSGSSRMNISAVLLAGGESRRMGKDKATLLFRGKPLWQIQLDLLRKLATAQIFVSARTDPPWRPANVHFVADDSPSRGPLSGLAAALAQVRAKHLLALAIDMPFMTEKYLRFLCDQIEPGRGVVAKIDDRFEPLAAIYPQEALANVQSALSGKDFSLQTVIGRLVAAGQLQVMPVTSHERKLFLNLNELADLRSSESA